jgi:hypothetical protein
MARHADAASTSLYRADRLAEAELPARLVAVCATFQPTCRSPAVGPARRHAKLDAVRLLEVEAVAPASGKNSPLRRASQKPSTARLKVGIAGRSRVDRRAESRLVAVEDAPALSFYNRLGFTPVGHCAVRGSAADASAPP